MSTILWAHQLEDKDPVLATILLDIYQVKSEIEGHCASSLSIVRSWDGSLYGETNAPIHGRKTVEVHKDGVVFVEGHMINGGLDIWETSLVKLYG